MHNFFSKIALNIRCKYAMGWAFLGGKFLGPGLALTGRIASSGSCGYTQIQGQAAFFFSSPGLKSYCHHFSSVVCRSSVNISHLNLLLRNHCPNCNQTLVEWSLDGPLPKLCPVIPISNQDGRQAKNRKKGGWNFNCPLLL